MDFLISRVYCTNFAWCNVLERVNDFSQIEKKNESPTYSCWFYKMKPKLVCSCISLTVNKEALLCSRAP